mmetsp:Transcript_9520/g.13799  ORF Transcript_9520/g.13799 Transcript_9520/m.13799 type:complete len:776 (+) Transcript_9520:576-2903(+)|eukprot:CAMPEP_0194076536 /NCGR_PEP_ID=MMETSP0149-20130528/3326_1 /TAXON_ID=122233 /ORGANISM="Chaetoceros debilis, Strain MM31A-1" /LENGTH=775 /DNA_ID=CAMNT_0038757309 /DNA_START=497 /DNA_END=2824 /DNA_ORIENTATION=-
MSPTPEAMQQLGGQQAQQYLQQQMQQQQQQQQSINHHQQQMQQTLNSPAFTFGSFNNNEISGSSDMNASAPSPNFQMPMHVGVNVNVNGVNVNGMNMNNSMNHNNADQHQHMNNSNANMGGMMMNNNNSNSMNLNHPQPTRPAPASSCDPSQILGNNLNNTLNSGNLAALQGFNFGQNQMLHQGNQVQVQSQSQLQSIPMQLQQQQQQQQLVSVGTNGGFNFNQVAVVAAPSTAAIAPSFNNSNQTTNGIKLPAFLTSAAPQAQAQASLQNVAAATGLNLQQYVRPPMNLPASLNTSTINVTTASYSDPKPNPTKQTIKMRPSSGTKLPSFNKQISQLSSSSSLLSPKIQVFKLAAVPTRKLASKSIVSLDPSMPPQSQDTPPNKFLAASSEIEMPTTVDVNVNVNVNKNCEVVQGPLTQQPSVATTDPQFQQMSRSSYSSACDATIAAQRALHASGRKDSEDTDILSVNSSASSILQSQDTYLPLDQIANVNAAPGTPISPSTASSGKRESPTSELENMQQQPKHKYVKVFGGKPSLPVVPSNTNLTLREYFSKMLRSRGYSTQHYCSLEGAYYCKPTDLQKASYGMKFIQAVRSSDADLLRKLLSAGLSPNPCNAFGESIIHMVCRRGDHKLLEIFLEHGSAIQVSDDFGRTPLHDACWTTTPCFKSVKLLLNKDPRLLHIVDCRGAAPLSYVKRENWGQWINFFEEQKAVWWPHRDVKTEGEEGPPSLSVKPPHSLPIANPPAAANIEDAKLLASGKKDVDAFANEQQTVVA